MFYISILIRIHCILLCNFVTVSMCVCHVDIKRYLLTYLFTYIPHIQYTHVHTAH